MSVRPAAVPLFKPEALHTEPEEQEDFLLPAASSVMHGRLPIVRLPDPHSGHEETTAPFLRFADYIPPMTVFTSVCSHCRGWMWWETLTSMRLTARIHLGPGLVYTGVL